MSLARLALVLLPLTLLGCGSHGPPAAQRASPSSEAHASGGYAPAAAGAKAPPAPLVPPGRGALSVMAPRSGLTVRSRPHGRILARLAPHTQWGSPTVVWAVERHGPWLGVITAALANNTVGWIDVRRTHPRMWRNEFSLEANLSARTLLLRRHGRVVDRMTVGIGSPYSPTPTGRFTVTDKLLPDRHAPYYGCCIIALSGHQPYLRPGWAGGDRIAIHGGPVGTAASAGCLHADPAQLRKLMRLIPVGTPVRIRA